MVPLVSVGGTPPGTSPPPPDDAWRDSFESIFLRAVRLKRLLATGLTASATRPGDGAFAGTGGSVVFVLAASVRVPLAELAVSKRPVPRPCRHRQDACRGTRAGRHPNERDPLGQNRHRKS